MKIPVPDKPVFQIQAVSPLELKDRLMALHRHGLPRGDLTGWPSMDEHYSVLRGQWTLVTGIPGHGKSEWLDAVMMNLALKSNWVFAIFSPENQPHELHLSKLMEKLLRKPFNHGPTDRIGDDEAVSSLAWMDSHFRFMKPHPDLQVPGIRSVIESCARFINDNDEATGGVNKYGIVIDPWNELEHKRPSNQSETEYISETLSYVRQFAREFNVHVFMVAHPRILHRDKDGKRPVPTPYDVSGSAHWFNKADNCITVWRDTNPDTRSQEVKVYVQKIRFKNVGKIGDITLRYDRVTGIYSEPLKVVDDYKRAAAVDI